MTGKTHDFQQHRPEPHCTCFYYTRRLLLADAKAAPGIIFRHALTMLRHERPEHSCQCFPDKLANSRLAANSIAD
jgi:hypothetical protein